MSAHTPGPWEALPSLANESTGKADYLVVGPNGEEIADMVCRSAANARLIAAAPELLAALKQARLMIDPFVHDTSDIDAIIAKAEGRE